MIFDYDDLVKEGVLLIDFSDLVRAIKESSDTEITDEQAWKNFIDWHNAAAIREFKKIIGKDNYSMILSDSDSGYIADMKRVELFLTIRQMKLARITYQDDGFLSATTDATTLTVADYQRMIQRYYNRAMMIIRSYYSIDSGEVYRL